MAPDIDGLFDLFADDLRRSTIDCLQEAKRDRMSLEELVEDLERSQDSRRWDFDENQLRLFLHHDHLPKLAGHEVIEYDPSNREIRYMGDDSLESVLDAIRLFDA